MNIFCIGPIELHDDVLVLRTAGRTVPVGRKVALTLLALAERPHEAVPKTELIARIWPEGFVGDGNLAQNIYVLRKIFREAGLADAIETVSNTGYKLTVRVTQFDPAPAAVQRTSRVAGAPVAVVIAACILVACVSLVVATGSIRRVASPGNAAVADQAYQLGRYYLNQRTPEGVRSSVHFFTQAMEARPYDARPYSGMADANVVIGDYCYGLHRPSVYFARAKWYVNRALALNPRSAEAHASSGFLAMHSGNEQLAQRELRSAISLNNSYAPAHAWYAILLTRQGQDAAAAPELRKAADLDPLSVPTLAWLASVSYRGRRYDDAVAYARMALDLQPARADALLALGRAYVAEHRFAPAIQALRRYVALSPLNRIPAATALADALHQAGRAAEARTEISFARRHPVKHATSAALENQL